MGSNGFNAKKLSRSRSTVRWGSSVGTRSCVLSCAACRTPRTPWDTRTPLCVGRVRDRAMFSLVCTLSSLTSAEDRSPVFSRFTGTPVQSDPSRPYMAAVRHFAFAARSRSRMTRGSLEVSRFSGLLLLGVPGFFDSAGPTSHSRLRWPIVLPSPSEDGVGALEEIFGAQSPRPPMPLSTLQASPHGGNQQDSGSGRSQSRSSRRGHRPGRAARAHPGSREALGPPGSSLTQSAVSAAGRACQEGRCLASDCDSPTSTVRPSHPLPPDCLLIHNGQAGIVDQDNT